MSSGAARDPQGPKSPAPAPLLALAARCGQRRRYATGARLFAAGDPVRGLHLVVEGTVRIVREADGRAVVVHREGPGGVLGEVALFTDGRYPATAVALEPTVTLLVASADVQRAIAGGGPLAEVLLRRLAGRTREVIGRLDAMVHLTVARRLAHHLLARMTAARSHEISLGMTQVALAEELGTVKELVVRELRGLRQRGLVVPAGRGRYRVVDAVALERFAGR